jgi:wobble nucleotide-excising tRNase
MSSWTLLLSAAVIIRAIYDASEKMEENLEQHRVEVKKTLEKLEKKLEKLGKHIVEKVE